VGKSVAATSYEGVRQAQAMTGIGITCKVGGETACFSYGRLLLAQILACKIFAPDIKFCARKTGQRKQRAQLGIQRFMDRA
jgi:hypothetical protein